MLLIICNSARAQITLEHTMPINIVTEFGFYNNFSKSGWKYVVAESSIPDVYGTYTLTTIKIYNLDYSLWKSIAIPQRPNYLAFLHEWIDGESEYHRLSEELFDNDGSNIEMTIRYSYDYFNSPPPTPSTKILRYDIIDERGQIRMSIDDNLSFTYAGEGKYKLHTYYPDINQPTELRIYSLPGTLPCDECSTSNTGNKPISSDGMQGFMLSDPAPNPSGKETSIAYRLPQSTPGSKLLLFDVNGAVLRSYPLHDSNGSLQIDVSTLPPGHYFYQIKTAVGNSSAKKMLVIK